MTGILRANGKVKRVNQTLILLISKLTALKTGEWYLSVAQQCLNTTFHHSIGMTPFQVLFGTRLRFKDDPSMREMIKKEFVIYFEEKRDEIREFAKDRLNAI